MICQTHILFRSMALSSLITPSRRSTVLLPSENSIVLSMRKQDWKPISVRSLAFQFLQKVYLTLISWTIAFLKMYSRGYDWASLLQRHCSTTVDLLFWMIKTLVSLLISKMKVWLSISYKTDLNHNWTHWNQMISILRKSLNWLKSRLTNFQITISLTCTGFTLMKEKCYRRT